MNIYETANLSQLKVKPLRLDQYTEQENSCNRLMLDNHQKKGIDLIIKMQPDKTCSLLYYKRNLPLTRSCLLTHAKTPNSIYKNSQ
jgi:hypothetical protein